MYKTPYAGDNTLRGPSPAIWGNCPIGEILEDPNKGIMFRDDFLSFGGIVSSTVGSYPNPYGNYKSLETANFTIVQSNSVAGGAITLTDATGADNDVAAMEVGYGNGGSFITTAGSGPPLWFECAIRVASTYDITAAKDFFIGLATKGMTAAATTLFSDTAGTMATSSINLMGFVQLNSGSVIKSCIQNHAAIARTAGTVATLAVSTWYKLGFLYNYNDVNGKPLRWFLNGVEKDSITSDTIADFPTAVQLTPTFVYKVQASDAAPNIDIDWWQCAQLFTGL